MILSDSIVVNILSHGGRLLRVCEPQIGVKSTGKNPILKAWQDAPSIPPDVAKKMIAAGQQLGVNITHGAFFVIDSDMDILDSSMIRSYLMSKTLCFYRSNDDRYKAVFLISDPENIDLPKGEYTNGDYDIYLPYAHRQIVICGKHYTGATIETNNRPIATITAKTALDFVTSLGISTEDDKSSTPPKRDKGEPLVKIEVVMSPDLNDCVSSDGWVNGCITGHTGINAGYNIQTNSFKIYSAKWVAQHGGIDHGNAWVYFAVTRGIDPENKTEMISRLKKEKIIK